MSWEPEMAAQTLEKRCNNDDASQRRFNSPVNSPV